MSNETKKEAPKKVEKIDDLKPIIKEQIEKLEIKAKKYHDDAMNFRNRFLSIRIPIIILGIIVPYILALQASNPNLIFIVASSALALLVAIFSGLDTFLKWGEVSTGYLNTSYNLRKAQRKLLADTEKFRFEVQTEKITEKEGITKTLEAIDEFKRSRDQTISQQEDTCVNRQIQAYIETKPSHEGSTLKKD